MKKIVSIVLVLCMCFSTVAILSSCNKHEHTWDEGKITTPATANADGVKTYTCTECGETKTEAIKLVTTITKDQWIANINSKNWTYSGDNGNNQILTMKITETAVQVTVTSNSEIVTDYYIAIKDGNYYSVVRFEDKYYEMPTDNETSWINSSLAQIMLEESDAAAIGAYYDRLTYDQTKKAYILNDEEHDIENTEFYFENGVLVKIITDGDTVMISNIGTTTITIPEFAPYPSGDQSTQ